MMGLIGQVWKHCEVWRLLVLISRLTHLFVWCGHMVACARVFVGVCVHCLVSGMAHPPCFLCGGGWCVVVLRVVVWWL